MITAIPGVKTQGARAIERTFCASWSKTPQLIAGARKPSPIKLRPVSAKMIAGIAKVNDAMIWLKNEGRHMAEDHPHLA